MPALIHSDRGPSLVSPELHMCLTEKGLAMSHTTAYNPAGNKLRSTMELWGKLLH